MLLYFVAQIVQLWPLGALVLIIVQSCDLWHTLINERFVLRFWGNTSLLSDTTKYYSLILYISCPSPRIRYSPNKQRICIFKSIWSIIVNMPSRNHSVLIYNHYSNRYENVHLPHTLANVGQCLWDEMVCVSSLCNNFHVTIWFPVELQEGTAIGADYLVSCWTSRGKCQVGCKLALFSADLWVFPNLPFPNLPSLPLQLDFT